jgi:hypothetical protein
MKKLLAAFVLGLFVNAASAQERVPQDQAVPIAKLLAETAAKIADAQIKIELDTAYPFGLKADEVGAMVIPVKNLSEETFTKAGKDVSPVAQLWFKKLTTVVDNKTVPNDKLRLLKVSHNGEDFELPLFLLGVRKKADGALEMVVYAKDKQPLVVLPVEKAEANLELPIELEGKKTGEDTGELTLKLAGKYRVKLPLTKQE